MIVYLATNTVNGMQYVGCSTRKHMSHRKDGHFRQARKGQGGPASIWQAIRDFGREAFQFEVIERTETVEQLREREMYWIEERNTLAPNGYNQNRGGAVSAFDEYKKEYVVDGKSYYGLGQLSDAFGVHELTIGVRLRRQGWTLREAVGLDPAPPLPKREGNRFDFRGKTFSSEKEMCRHYGVCDNVFRQRYHRNGWTLEEALEVEERIKRHPFQKEVTVQGKMFSSITQAADHYGINRNSVTSRLNYGWTLEEALTTPLIPNSRPKPFRTYVLQGKTFRTYQEIGDHFGISAKAVTGRIHRNKDKTLDEIFSKEKNYWSARNHHPTS